MDGWMDGWMDDGTRMRSNNQTRPIRSPGYIHTYIRDQQRKAMVYCNCRERRIHPSLQTSFRPEGGTVDHNWEVVYDRRIMIIVGGLNDGQGRYKTTGRGFKAKKFMNIMMNSNN
jgi:hypothetical protein